MIDRHSFRKVTECEHLRAGTHRRTCFVKQQNNMCYQKHNLTS